MEGHDNLRARLLEGLVIPAHPLALTAELALDERHQRALTRYYLAAGAGGLAVGVHTTQFEIHDPEVGLFRPVLELAMEEAKREEAKREEAKREEAKRAEEAQQADRPRPVRPRPVRPRPVMIAGLVGKTDQALREAHVARDLGYDCGLLSLGAMGEASIGELIEHAAAVAEVIPLFGFYLQQAVGGRLLPYRFWRRFAEIESVVAIKMAPFDRYQTLDVVRAVAEAGRLSEIALYTGNDDHIVADLLAEFPYGDGAYDGEARIAGGLLGHWAVWTRKAVGLLEQIKAVRRDGGAVPEGLLKRGLEITDANAAFFDPQHGFAGSIAGIHEVLRRQGLLQGRWALNPKEKLSPGQMEEIDRVYAAYPHLSDDDFVREHIDEWLS